MQGRRGSRAARPEVRPPQRRAIATQLREGVRIKDVAAQFGCSEVTVWRIGSQAQLRRRRVDHSRLRLRFEEREQISRGIAAGLSARTIARGLGRAPSTVSREIKRCGGRRRYRALSAERAAIGRLARPKPGKLGRSPQLRAAVEAGLDRRWSPQQISARLRIEYPEDPQMQISHETIYQSLYIQSRGELRAQLTANLRRGRARRQVRGAPEHRGRIADMVAISERPPEVSDRAVPGHWEGDLLVGEAGRSFVATLVERQTRYAMVARLGMSARAPM